jgi:hypothetical protein
VRASPADVDVGRTPTTAVDLTVDATAVTATPAAPDATTIKKKKPSDVAVKKWLGAMPFIFLNLAVNSTANAVVHMGCTICRDHYGPTSNKPYASGTALVWSWHDLVKHRDVSKEHITARDANTKKMGGKGGMPEAARAFARARIEVLKGLLPTLLSAALWLCAELLPCVEFASLLVLLVKCGNTSINAKYNSPEYLYACVFALASVLLKQQLEDIRAAPFFTIVVDSSTDCSTQDHLLHIHQPRGGVICKHGLS